MRVIAGRARVVGGTLALIVLCGTLVLTVAVPPASAATVTIGTIQAQMADHVGVNNGTSGNCIRYSPTGTTTSTALVSSPNEALTAHGARNGNCPGTLSTTNQSAVGFSPSSRTTVQDGELFLIGRMVHYNNPIQANDRYFTGMLNTVLSGFSAPNTLTFDWTLDETPNSGAGNCCNDEITFDNQIASTTLTQGGLRFRLVMHGFVPVANASACPAVAAGSPQNEFSTVEGQQTHACLYATVQQLRSLTIVKNVVGSPPTARTFNFTSTSTLAGSPWSNTSFDLGASQSVTRDLTSGNSVTVTETEPGDDRWTLTALTCTQIGAGGAPELVPGATLNVAARRAQLVNIPPPPNLAAPGITCTFTNTYTPRSTLTLLKQVNSGSAAPLLWTLTATGAAAASGSSISGPSGSTAVTTQRVPAGPYDLTELGTGAASTGYIQDGAWSCRTAAGTVVPVTAGRVTLPDTAAATTTANVTCTVANRLATGSLRILKEVDAPAGAYTGGATKTFAGTYNCGAGFTGSFSTLTTAVPVTISSIPAGRLCTVAETPPTGGLLNDSYAWGTPSFSAQPVTIADQATSDVTITNTVSQRFGTFAVTKAVDGPGGYTGGVGRPFPVQYTCLLTNGPTTSGSLDVTPSQAASPSTPIPAGSVCSFTETLTFQPGDFIDSSYVWGTQVVTPATVTIADGTTAALTITNPYVRQFGSLVIAKQVIGAGYSGGIGPNFTIGYDCGPGFTGTVVLPDNGSQTVTGIPAGAACAVQEVPPQADLLDPAFAWGTPEWVPGPVVEVPANGSASVTARNPTVPIFGQIRVTKQIAGATEGVVGGATFRVVVTCGLTQVADLTVAVGQTESTPDIPVGSQCTVAEDPPSGGLVDGSYAWAPGSGGSTTVTITSSGQVIPVTMANTVERVFGSLSLSKAPIATPGIVDPSRTFAIDYSCAYGNDPAVTGTVTVQAGQAALSQPVLVGSRCVVTEQPGSLAAPPSASDPSWVWLPVTIQPSDNVTVTGTTPVSVAAVNSIVQRTASFSVTKAVTGAGKDAGYTGGDFTFAVDCNGTVDTFALADGESFNSAPVPAFTTCTLTETGTPPTDPAFGWDPAQFSVDGQPPGPGPVTFTIPADAAPIQINVRNPITPRVGSVVVAKTVTGLTAGLDPGAPPFAFTLSCGTGLTFQLAVPANESTTQGGIPVGSTCVAIESATTGGLVDASYAWAPPRYVPTDATVTVTSGAPPTVTVTNEIVRVTAPVHLVKTFTGAQGVIDADRTYPVDWVCRYNGADVAAGHADIVAGPVGIEVAPDVPATSVCTATEGDLGTPSNDPAFRWEAPVITGTTVAAPGPNTITVANSLVRDNGSVLVQKVVTGATEGYIGTGEDFTLHGQCRVPGQPLIQVRTRDGTIANNGEVLIEPVSVDWTCEGFEDTPSQDLLKDASYAWGPAILTPSGDFTLTAAGQQVVFRAENPVIRVRSSFSIIKQVVDPFGAVGPSATFTGTYSCVYGSDAPVMGTWSISTNTTGTFTVPGLLLGSVCTVTEDDPGRTGLADGSHVWGPATIGLADPVVAGGTASVPVTNTVIRLWSGLQLTKSVVDPDGGLVAGAQFGGVWVCVQGSDSFSDRFTVTVADAAVGGVVTLFTPAAQRVPATAMCTVTEDTLDAKGLRDASFAWGDPTYVPGSVELVAGQIASLGISNTVVRVYSAVTISKQISGPATGLVSTTRPFIGTLTCQYGDDAPVVVSWSATLATPVLRAGILVGSACSATEDPPGATGEPVAGDPSYIWRAPVISGPVTVAPPGVATSIVVTNPTDRLFGTFSVSKRVTGAVEGIVDLGAPFPMSYSCSPGSGSPITGELDVTITVGRTVGPERQIPTGSTCTLTEPLETMPPLADAAWAWGEPTFTIDGVPATGNGRTVTFVIPTPQEDEPEPNVGVGVVNSVLKVAGGAFSVSKSSDPPGGTLVAPGTVITYTLTVDSTGTVPVHGIIAVDDLAGVLLYATLVAGSITAPAPTTATFDTATQQLDWTIGTMAVDASLSMTYQIRVNDDATGVTLRNSVTGSGDVPAIPPQCPDDAPADDQCAVSHLTSPAPTITKTVSSPPTLNPDGTVTLAYDIVVTNAGELATAYTLTDTFAFASGVRVTAVSTTNLEPGTIATNAAFDGATTNTIATASIAAGASHRYRVTLTANVGGVRGNAALDCTLDPGETGTGFLNRAAVNPTAEACAPIPNAADLRVVKEVDAAAVTIDRRTGTRVRIVYTIRVTNAGPLSAVDAVATDTLPGSVIPVSAVPSVGSCARAGATLTCPLGTMAPGASARIVVTIELPASYPNDTVRNSATVSSATADPDASNNASVVSTRVSFRSTIPITGTQIAGLMAGGLGLVGAGVALVLAAQRRRRRPSVT